MTIIIYHIVAAIRKSFSASGSVYQHDGTFAVEDEPSADHPVQDGPIHQGPLFGSSTFSVEYRERCLELRQGFFNPNGIEAFSPALHVSRYLG